MTHPKALQTVLRDYRLVFYLLGGTGWWGEEKQECNRGGGGGAEREREGGFGPFGRRGRGSVTQSESTFTVAFFSFFPQQSRK